MTGWQVQAMWEADAAAEWERLNAPDPFEDQMKKAALELRLAVEQINKAEDYLYDAICELAETPMEAKVESLLQDIEDRHAEIRMLAEHYGKGERE